MPLWAPSFQHLEYKQNHIGQGSHYRERERTMHGLKIKVSSYVVNTEWRNEAKWPWMLAHMNPQSTDAGCWAHSPRFWNSVAWMPDELSPAHNIVCWSSSVWHRSVEEKLWPITNQSDQSNCQDGLYTMMNRWSDQSNCQGGLHTMLDRSPVRSSRAGPRAGLPGRGAPGPRTGDTRGSYLAPGRCARRVPLTSGDIRNFLVQ